MGLELEGEPIIKAPENFWPVLYDGEKIGRLSRAFYSPRLTRNIGLAILKVDFCKEGTEVLVDSPYGDLISKVVKLPWFKADKETYLD